MSTPQVGTRYLHFSVGAHVYTSQGTGADRGPPNSVLLLLGLSTWDMRGHEVLQGILTSPVVTKDGHGGNLYGSKRKPSISLLCVDIARRDLGGIQEELVLRGYLLTW